MKSRFNTATPIKMSNRNLNQIMNDSNSGLEDVLSSPDFVSFWLHCDPTLLSFLFVHIDEIIKTAYAAQTQSPYSFRCLQILSTSNPDFQKRLFTETHFLQFTHDYLFNISAYPSFSQKNYFNLLSIMIANRANLNIIFDTKYLERLFEAIDNNSVFPFTYKIVTSPPSAITQSLLRIDPAFILINNLKQNSNSVLINRSQALFQKLIGSRLEGNAAQLLYSQIDILIDNAIQSQNHHLFNFIQFINQYSSEQFFFSKWKKVNSKIIPYLSHFCKTGMPPQPDIFTPLQESCIKLSISIISTTKQMPNEFIELFEKLYISFFILERNSFLHNCFLNSFNILLSSGIINCQYLDKLDMFNKIIKCYESRATNCICASWGHIRQLSESIDKFAQQSQTVNLNQWHLVVMSRNNSSETIITKNYGGIVPFNINATKNSLKELFLFIGGATFILSLFVLIMLLVNNKY